MGGVHASHLGQRSSKKVHFVRVLVLFDELNYVFPFFRTMLS